MSFEGFCWEGGLLRGLLSVFGNVGVDGKLDGENMTSIIGRYSSCGCSSLFNRETKLFFGYCEGLLPNHKCVVSIRKLHAQLYLCERSMVCSRPQSGNFI